MEITNQFLLIELKEIEKELASKGKITNRQEISLEDQTIAYLISIYKATKILIG